MIILQAIAHPLNLILCDRHISGQFIKMIVHNTVSDGENLLNLAYNFLRKKVSFGLLKLMEKYKTDKKAAVVELDVSRENMALTLGVATESLIRTLSDFKSEKLIDIQNGKVIILNEKRLGSLPYYDTLTHPNHPNRPAFRMKLRECCSSFHPHHFAVLMSIHP